MSGAGRPQVLEQDGVTIVAFGPEFKRITEEKISAASRSLLEAAEGDTTRLVVDLSQTEFFGSSFIEALFRAWNRIQPKPGGAFAICGLTEYCAEILEVTNLDSLWKLYPTRQAAVSALAPSAR